MNQSLKQYILITLNYWAFTITDGAIRMLVVLYFHLLGYSPFEVAMLFLFYEFFGIVTNLVGGWLGSRIGLNRTMQIGTGLQVVALAMLTVPDAWLGVAYVMFAQALSGIAKDLNKMSAKASIKTILPEQDGNEKLFKWIAVLTGSKNTLKGVGFFIGAMLLQVFEFRGALGILSASLLLVLIFSMFTLTSEPGKKKYKPKFREIFSKSSKLNWLSVSRFFLFAARDVWFVVALPVYLYTEFNWSFMQVGSYLAAWIIGYGIVQASAPRLLRRTHQGHGPGSRTAVLWVFILAVVPGLIALSKITGFNSFWIITLGLIVFGVIFAVNSAVHSFLIVAWSEREHVSMNVGFYYMANAGGRLMGTVLSGWIYQSQGLTGCLWFSTIFLIFSGVASLRLTAHDKS